jgi:4-hydroxyacetophenone monooxygenase
MLHTNGRLADETSNASQQAELRSASDAVIDDAMAFADPMVLRGLMHQLTGDETLADIELGSQVMGNFIATVVAKDSDIADLRSKAAAYLKAFRDRGGGEMDLGHPERLYRSFRLTAGVNLPESEREMWMEQSALDPWARGLVWDEGPAPEARAKFTVGVIGTGLSGLNAMVQLKRAGIPYIAIEKNSEVGGTWWENKYPGARVDSPSRTYTHIFGVGFPYPYNYCPRDENLKYMRWVADSFDLRDGIEFNTEVTSLAWDETTQEWEIKATGPQGSRAFRVNAVISCVGFLSRPKMPEIPGMDAFQGRAAHTAQWPSDLDVAGKRVAIIGSGASGYQTMPVIAKQAAHTLLFQRTPSWCFDNPTYVKPLPPQLLWLDRHFPYYANFARFRLSWVFGPDSFKRTNRIDPNFNDPYARSEVNKATRDARIAFVRRKLAGKPELIEKMIPEAPPMSSRPVIIDAEDSLFDALAKDNADLITDPIETITPTGIRAGGVDYPADVIIYATGFRANDFLWPLEVRGRDGVTIEALWAKDGPRAYIGALLPGFPNFFMAYGPNTNNFGGFQIVDLVEIEIRFALQCFAGLISQGKRSVDVTEEGYRRFNEELDEDERTMIYMDPRAHNYYQSEYGRSCVNGSIDFRRMWRWLRDPTGPAPNQTDAGLHPQFGKDLIVT